MGLRSPCAATQPAAEAKAGVERRRRQQQQQQQQQQQPASEAEAGRPSLLLREHMASREDNTRAPKQQRAL